MNLSIHVSEWLRNTGEGHVRKILVKEQPLSGAPHQTASPREAVWTMASMHLNLYTSSPPQQKQII